MTSYAQTNTHRTLRDSDPFCETQTILTILIKMVQISKTYTPHTEKGTFKKS